MDATTEAQLQRSQRSTAVGVLGSGPETSALVTRLASPERRVIIYPSPAKSQPLKNAEYAATLADVAYACSVVLSTIEDTAQMRDLVLGSDSRLGLGLELEPGSSIIDFGIRPPRECQALMGVLGMRGISLLDAAIVGAPQALAGGNATVLTGGFPDAVEAVMPLLSAIGRVERTGPLGSAHTAAALMGYMEAAHMIARDEAARIGTALGLTDATLARLIEPEAAAPNVVAFARRADLAGALAAERGISAEVIDLTIRKLRQPPPQNG